MSGCSEHDKPALAENEIEIQVPFIGTYGALSDCIDSEMEREADNWVDNDQDGVLHGTFFMGDYLRDYVHWVGDYCKLLTLKFREMTSPRYYNFETDRVFASVDKIDLWCAYKNINQDAYDYAVREWTTPRDGYSPYYRAEDFYFESIDEMVNAPACILGVILDTLCHTQLWEDVGDYDYKMLNVWSLYLECEEYHPIYEHLEVSAIESE